MKKTLLAAVALGVVACSSESSNSHNQAAAEQEPRYPHDVTRMLYERAVIEGSMRRLSERDRRAICESLLTNVETYDFCTDTVPEDWQPLEFNGETYYVIPLASMSEDE